MFLDTSGLLCYYQPSEPKHDDAVIFFNAASRRVVHNYVLVEFVSLAHTRRANRARALEFIVALVQNPKVTYVWIDQAMHARALNLLQSQLDKTYSLCDAVSFLVMRSRGMTEALTTDQHFAQAGFRALLA